VSGERWQDFAMHKQPSWREQAKNPHVDLWLRVAFLAFGTHNKNGHAPFLNGREIAERTTPLGKARPDERQIRRAIGDAVDRGLLSRQSGSKCLVVLPHWIKGGSEGSPSARCYRH
jgi:hypothetical protein